MVLAVDDAAALEPEDADEPEDAAEEVALAEVEAGVELACTAVAAHEQTASAEDETSRPVTAPQALSTHSRAALAMAEDCELLHWQAKSVEAQPTADPADSKQEVCGYRLATL